MSWNYSLKTQPIRASAVVGMSSQEGSMLFPLWVIPRGSKLERQADKMREIVAMLGWLTPLYLVCAFVSLPNEIKLLLFIFFFGHPKSPTP